MEAAGVEKAGRAAEAVKDGVSMEIAEAGGALEDMAPLALRWKDVGGCWDAWFGPAVVRRVDASPQAEDICDDGRTCDGPWVVAPLDDGFFNAGRPRVAAWPR